MLDRVTQGVCKIDMVCKYLQDNIPLNIDVIYYYHLIKYKLDFVLIDLYYKFLDFYLVNELYQPFI